MTECDIWIKIFDKLGFKFIEEYLFRDVKLELMNI
jgi:hypothetical protein